MRLLSLSLILMLGFSASAWSYDLRSQVETQNNMLAVSGEMSSFKLETGSISGTGIRVDFSHSFSPKLGIELFLSTALGQESSSFTGFGGYAFYNLLTECCDQNRILYVDGVPAVSENLKMKHLFQVGVGVNQFLLNGSKGVYSSSGPGLGANYLFQLYRFQIKASARLSEMISNNNKVQGTFLSLGVAFPL